MPSGLRANEDRIMRSTGWLAMMPEAFSADVLRRSLLKHYAPGKAIFQMGDPPGGIYGLVSGCLSLSSSPPDAAPQRIHIGATGAWTGEGCFMTRQPRRGEMRALTEVRMLHLPLQAMEDMAAADPMAVRAFAVISILGVDVLFRVIHDLQVRDVDRRIASVLHRLSVAAANANIPLSQSDVGEMANVSRKRVNVAFQRFTEAGWLAKPTGYRSIRITDPDALRLFVHEEGEN